MVDRILDRRSAWASISFVFDPATAPNRPRLSSLAERTEGCMFTRCLFALNEKGVLLTRHPFLSILKP
jgi:hypothetical protein